MSHQSVVIGQVKFSLLNGSWIADDTILGENVTVLPGAVLGRPPVSTKAQTRKTDSAVLPPLKIGKNSVIGSNVVLYRGSTVGDNCMFGDTACVREGVEIGDNNIIAMGVTINYDTKIGSNVKIMDNTHITGKMLIEDDVFIGMLVTSANDNSMGRNTILNKHDVEASPWLGPIIRRHATVGQGVCMLPGVEVGENSIIGANAVVTKSVPARVLAMGVPAKVIRDLQEDEIK
jgi:acetyltransferase-like isoleucine patch superfamily enzyme